MYSIGVENNIFIHSIQCRPNFAEIWAKIPSDRRLLETDDAAVAIQEVYKRAGVTEAELNPNFARLFPQLVV